jgi:hypothetical protein
MPVFLVERYWNIIYATSLCHIDLSHGGWRHLLYIVTWGVKDGCTLERAREKVWWRECSKTVAADDGSCGGRSESELMNKIVDLTSIWILLLIKQNGLGGDLTFSESTKDQEDVLLEGWGGLNGSRLLLYCTVYWWSRYDSCGLHAIYNILQLTPCVVYFVWFCWLVTVFK